MLNSCFGIIDKTGNLVVKYTYDAYGKCLSITGSNIGYLNPFRYKGYYFDSESGMYYCKSRYYVPEWGRWLNCDSINFLEPGNLYGLNLYAYCNNNPITLSDEFGNAPWWKTFLKILGGVAIIAGSVAASILTAGTTSVLFAGAAVGAFGGALGAAAGTIASGGNIEDFANSFLIGTITGAISGAAGASSIGMFGQIGINAGLGVVNYLTTQSMSGDNLTIGGIIINGFLGGFAGVIGGSGWMSGGNILTSLSTFTGRNFMSQLLGSVGFKSIAYSMFDSIVIGGIANGLYSQFSKECNPYGKFWSF